MVKRIDRAIETFFNWLQSLPSPWNKILTAYYSIVLFLSMVMVGSVLVAAVLFFFSGPPLLPRSTTFWDAYVTAFFLLFILAAPSIGVFEIWKRIKKPPLICCECQKRTYHVYIPTSHHYCRGCFDQTMQRRANAEQIDLDVLMHNMDVQDSRFHFARIDVQNLPAHPPTEEQRKE